MLVVVHGEALHSFLDRVLKLNFVMRDEKLQLGIHQQRNVQRNQAESAAGTVGSTARLFALLPSQSLPRQPLAIELAYTQLAIVRFRISKFHRLRSR